MIVRPVFVPENFSVPSKQNYGKYSDAEECELVGSVGGGRGRWNKGENGRTFQQCPIVTPIVCGH